MSFQRMLQLTDLPDDVLCRIAAEVSDAPPEPYANLKYQVRCTTENLVTLGPMRTSCRKLRHASLQVVAGLCNVDIGVLLLWTSLSSGISTHSFLGLPNLVSLENPRVRGYPMAALLGKLTPLKELTLHPATFFGNEQEAEVLTRIHCKSLRKIKLSLMSVCVLQTVFEALGSAIEDIEVTGICRQLPLLSGNALSSVRRVALEGCTRIDGLLQQLKLARNFSELSVRSCSFDARNLQNVSHMQSLELLGSCPHDIERIITDGIFPQLRKLVYNCHFDLGVEMDDDDYLGLCELLESKASSLRELDLDLSPGTTKPLAAVPLHPLCETKLTLNYPDDTFETADVVASSLLDPLVDFESLVSLHLIGVEAIKSLTSLVSLPKLRKLKLESCYFDDHGILKKFVDCAPSSISVEDVYYIDGEFISIDSRLAEYNFYQSLDNSWLGNNNNTSSQ